MNLNFKLHVVVHTYHGRIQTDVIGFDHQWQAEKAYAELIKNADSTHVFDSQPAKMTVTKLF